MSNRTLTLKGVLAERRAQKLELSGKAGRLVHELENHALPLSAVPLEEMRTGNILDIARELDAVKSKYLEVCAAIKEIEAELG